MKWLINLFTGGLVGEISDGINRWQKNSLDAKNQSERIEADRAINMLQARKDILVAESRDAWALRMRVLARFFFGAPLGVFVWKVVVYDKVLGLGVTDDLSADMWKLMYLVYTFYFASEIAWFLKGRK